MQMMKGPAALRRCMSTSTRQKLVIAVGGNALQRRGDRLTIENQLLATKAMAPHIAAIARENDVILTHGNGPQVGELALERSCAPFDVLGAETQGQIGHILAQAFASVGVDIAPILTQTVVDAADPAFYKPQKFVGPVYGFKEAEALAKQLDWTVKQDGEYYRRVVPSPKPQKIVQLDTIKLLLDSPQVPLVVACGGGGAPVARVFGEQVGVECVIDKDATGALLAKEVGADGFIILTDGGGIFENFGKPTAREMRRVTPMYLQARKSGQKYPGSMAPKVNAVIDFVTNSANPNAWAAICDLNDVEHVINGDVGTRIVSFIDGEEDVEWREGNTPPPPPPVVDSDDDHGDSDTPAQH